MNIIYPYDFLSYSEGVTTPVIITQSTYAKGGFQKNTKDKLVSREPAWMGKKRQFNSEGKVWTTEDQAIAIVDQNGWITALQEAVTSIYAASEDGRVIDCFVINPPASTYPIFS